MAQTVTIPKSILQELIDRITRLEKIVLGETQVLKAIKIYEDEKKKGKLKKLKTIDELFS
ncbi:MAG: hypothetical protein ACE5IW_13175 [bacterium]